MRASNLGVLWLAAIVGASGAQSVNSAEARASPDSNRSGRIVAGTTFARDMARVRELSPNADLRERSRLADEFFEDWSTGRDNELQRLIASICSRVKQEVPNTPSRNRLLEQWSSRAVEASKTVDLETELALAEHLVTKEDRLTPIWNDPDRMRQRRRLTRTILRIACRIEREARDHWIPHTVYTNLSPPRGMKSGLAGMSPENIDDPALRAEYKAALAENARKASENLKQWLLTKAKREWLPRAEAKIAALYRDTPADLAELQEALADGSASKSLQQRIITKVSATGKEAAAPGAQQ